ncbi:mannitol dehydrogenase family protein [Sulfitobacter albidus]|uniref:Mannitol dehydrogenase family protein n=1 Tax=Sulfitobacter albidus TaxID=2829501 RepID=A0A975PP52_9RHOB|nr:mannitol dehydrogenase family protein [Sulfitobacter albidus]QUJ78171.1 mannitol dehydrogenase family protein [Sulfitobacter albidus]
MVGVSLRSATVRDGLAAQDFAYDLVVQGQGAKRIEVLRDVLVAPEDPGAVLEAMQEAQIISATVTEKGYHLDTGGQLNLTDPSIAADVAGQGPSTLIGLLARHLATRSTPLTVLSCDNRTGNGAVLRAAVARFSQAAGLKIDWAAVRFPNAMVDRITPATTDALRRAQGDPMAVPTEPFREWVIEDDFAGPRPVWPGVQFVADVAPHELRKLRMLNGAHSLMAYAGLVRGHTFVHEAVADPQIRAQIGAFMDDAGRTLPVSVRDEAPAYARALIARFENEEIRHRLEQIAMDGTQKLPYRLVAPLREGATAAAGGIAAWLEFCAAEVARGAC